jgi:hypothetical protein
LVSYGSTPLKHKPIMPILGHIKGVSILADKDLIGKVIHYYDKIQVAVLKLSKSLKVGDKVKFVHGEKNFEQTVESMQLEHKQIDSGKKGQEVAVKVDKEAKSGSLVYQA